MRRTRLFRQLAVSALAMATAITPSLGLSAEPDKRIAKAGTLKDLDGRFPFTPPASKEPWEKRADVVRQQLKVALGLWPMPTMAPLKPTIHGKREMNGYTVEKVYFESLPGFYVTGTLYRPANIDPSKKYPVVLNAHGHWDNARFYNASESEIRNALAIGAERWENAARNHLQACCVQLARMGCVVFQWDMIGYCDSQQINFDRSHRFAKQDPATEETDEGWLLFSPRAESNSQSVMGLQTLNTIQSLEFVLALPEVDSSRVAITGASGGGTQTFIAAAVDPRISIAFPAVMVSTSMQGGCTCENACGLRINTGNIEIAGLIAPRPLGMTAANDWTRNMATDGFPQLQQLYSLYGAKERVALFPAVHFDHNYNHVARVGLYGWLNQFWNLGQKTPVLESDFEVLSGKDLTVWDADHPAPAGGEDFERRLLKAWALDVRKKIAAPLSLDAPEADRKAALEVLQKGWQGLLGPVLADFENDATGELQWKVVKYGDRVFQQASVPNKQSGVDGVLLRENSTPPTKNAVLFIDDQLLPASAAERQKALGANASADWTVYQVITVGQELDNASGKLTNDDEQPLVGNPRLSASYTYGYNWPVATKRVHQVLAAIAELKKSGVTRITLAGDDSWTKAGVALQAGKSVDPVRVVVTASDSSVAPSIRSINFRAGEDRYLGLRGLALAAGAEIEIQK